MRRLYSQFRIELAILGKGSAIGTGLTTAGVTGFKAWYTDDGSSSVRKGIEFGETNLNLVLCGVAVALAAFYFSSKHPRPTPTPVH